MRKYFLFCGFVSLAIVGCASEEELSAREKAEMACDGLGAYDYQTCVANMLNGGGVGTGQDYNMPQNNNGNDTNEQPCDTTGVDATALAICNVQHSQTQPAARSFGARCTSDYDCDSNWCDGHFADEMFCTVRCAGMCPEGWTCDDFGSCLKSSCNYDAGDKADCATTHYENAKDACSAGCLQQYAAWLNCRQTVGFACTSSTVDDACGFQEAALRQCVGDNIYQFTAF